MHVVVEFTLDVHPNGFIGVTLDRWFDIGPLTAAASGTCVPQAKDCQYRIWQKYNLLE